MVSWFRGVIKAVFDTADGIKIAKAIGRGVRDLKDIRGMQQRGFTSVPLDSDTALFLQADDLVVAIATATKDKPLAQPGETILYASEKVFVKLNPNGTVRAQGSDDTYVEILPDGKIHVKGTKVTIEADEAVNVLAPKVGLGHDSGIATPADRIVNCSSACILGTLHPDGVAGVSAPKVPVS